jgi:basic membrane protein A and related proteins
MYKAFSRVLPVLFLLLAPLPAQAEDAIRAAIVFNRNVKEIDDKSFITAVKAGAERATRELGIPLEIRQQDPAQSDEEFLSGVADDGVDVIIGMSFVDTSSLLDMAERYPDVKFMVVDGVVPPLYTNAKSVIFREHEGSFLVGIIAALKSKTGKIGFIGGRDLPLIRNFAGGFRQGARYVNPDIEIAEAMVGKDYSAWDNPAKARQMADEQYANGVDVIFAAAGASGLGVLEAAAQRDGIYAIGVDSNQNYLFPGHVLTSMIKRVDVAIYEALKDVKTDRWQPGILNLGLKENGLDYAVDEHNKDLLDEAMINVVEDARQRIIDGTLTVQMYSPGSSR